jgi:hypothetical protein
MQAPTSEKIEQTTAAIAMPARSERFGRRPILPID